MAFFQETIYLEQKKDEAYVISLDYKVKKHTRFYYFDKNLALFFDYSGIKYIPLEVLNKIKNKSITYNYLEYKIMNLLYVDFIVLPL